LPAIIYLLPGKIKKEKSKGVGGVLKKDTQENPAHP